jgi:arylsulfatase A-like enzyme
MSSPASRPNVIWVFGDQHRGQALSCAGDPNVNTPHVDRLAREGCWFPQAVSGFPLCCPFRGSLLTSRYPHRCVPGHEFPLPEDVPTLADVFREHGYHTAYFGKWHVAGWKERDGRAAMYITDPDRRGGFDDWVGYENNNAQWDCWVHGGASDDAFHCRLDGYETDRMTDMLIGHIRRQAEGGEGPGEASGGARPFFAVLSVQPPHDPYLAPAEFMARHNPARLELRPNVPAIPRVEGVARRELAGYYAQIENLDWNIGRIREALFETGLNENTYIVFFSDHGDMHGSHGMHRKTCPYEESIRIPMVICADSTNYGIRPHECPAPINHVDIAPTTLGLCGIDPPEHFEGTDYSGCFLTGRQPGELPESAYLQAVTPTCHGDSIDRPWRGVVTRDGWKYVCLEGQPWLMFDLNEDPYEQANLAHNSRYWPERKRLQGMLADWIDRTGDEFDLPDPPPR